MVKMTKPPRFKASQPPRAIAAQKIAREGRFRGSPAERGYDSKWNRLSIAYRKHAPWCEWCAQVGLDSTLTDLVDHMIPVVDRPDLVHSWKNLFSLCKYHHGRKFSLERYARDNGLLEMLPIWCKDLTKMPREFR
jgi:hypothetical protein